MYDAALRDMKALQAELKRLPYKEGQLEALGADKRRLAADVHALRERVDTLEARCVRASKV